MQVKLGLFTDFEQIPDLWQGSNEWLLQFAPSIILLKHQPLKEFGSESGESMSKAMLNTAKTYVAK